jgi:hypothetical protein
MKKNKTKTNDSYKKPRRVLLTLIFVSVLFLSVGYAAVTGVSLEITGTAKSNNNELMITDITYFGDVNADVPNSSINNYYLTIMNSKVALTNDKTSEITYNVTIHNFDNVFKKYKETIYDPSFYDNADITFELDGIDTSVVLAPNDTLTFKITFKYKEEKEDYTNTVLNSILNFKFDDVDYVAKIGTTYYEKIQTAINTATTSDLVTIDIIKDTQESSSISETQKIKINMNGHSIINLNNSSVFNNSGELEINGGTLTMDEKQAVVNNNLDSSRLIINGTKIVATYNRQAVYNKGYCELTDIDFYAESNERAAIQNESGGTVILKSGKVKAPNYYGIQNNGTLEIGVSGEPISQTNPEIIGGKDYGVNGSGNISFYDGIVKGPTKPFSNANKVVAMEPDYGLARGEDIIDGIHYLTDYPGAIAVVTFNYDGGVSSENKRNVEIGKEIGTLPTSNKLGFVLDGWYTAKTGGEKISSDTIITGKVTFYARWEGVLVANYDGNDFSTIQGAIDSVPSDDSEYVIEVTDDTIENIVVPPGKNIILDLNQHTLGNRANNCVIDNSGNLTIRNGTLASTSDKAATINNKNGGVVNLVGGSITNSHSIRQAVYNPAGGIVNISGDAYLSSTTTGNASSPATIKRGTVQNEAGGIINITGGTIACSTQYAVANEGELNIGTKDGTINTTKPDLTGEMHTILNKAGAVLNIYDGNFKGKLGIINGSYTELEEDTHMTDIMDGSYHTSHLELN